MPISELNLSHLEKKRLPRKVEKMMQRKSQRNEKQTVVICLRIHRRGVSRRRLVHVCRAGALTTALRWCFWITGREEELSGRNVHGMEAGVRGGS